MGQRMAVAHQFQPGLHMCGGLVKLVLLVGDIRQAQVQIDDSGRLW